MLKISFFDERFARRGPPVHFSSKRALTEWPQRKLYMNAGFVIVRESRALLDSSGDVERDASIDLMFWLANLAASL